MSYKGLFYLERDAEKNKAMTIFENVEFGQITAIEKDGEPWFIGKEVADILGYSRTNKMTVRLDNDEKANAPFWDDRSKQQRVQTIINESGIYNAILSMYALGLHAG